VSGGGEEKGVDDGVLVGMIKRCGRAEAVTGPGRRLTIIARCCALRCRRKGVGRGGVNQTAEVDQMKGDRGDDTQRMAESTEEKAAEIVKGPEAYGR